MCKVQLFVCGPYGKTLLLMWQGKMYQLWLLISGPNGKTMLLMWPIAVWILASKPVYTCRYCASVGQLCGNLVVDCLPTHPQRLYNVSTGFSSFHSLTNFKKLFRQLTFSTASFFVNSTFLRNLHTFHPAALDYSSFPFTKAGNNPKQQVTQWIVIAREDQVFLQKAYSHIYGC